MKKNKSSYEGIQENIPALKLPAIEVFTNKYSQKNYEVRLSIPEFTSICPKTALPDFAIINITYGPDRSCIELKSLKLYFVAYRNVGIFHEHLTNKILDDFVKACQPRWAQIEVIMNPRGGIGTTVVAEYKRKK